MLISQAFSSATQKSPAQSAVHFLGKSTNFGELRVLVGRLSYLYQNEMGQNAVVGFLTSNSPAMLPTFLALANNRSITVPLDPMASFEVLGAWIREAGVTHLAISSDRTTQVRELCSAERLNLPVVEYEKKHGGEYDPVFAPPTENPPLETDTILCLRTLGTTGVPKLVTFDHKRVLHSAQALRGVYKASNSDRVLSTLNFYHPFAFFHGMLFPGMCGVTTVINDGVEQENPTRAFVESKITRLVTEPEFATRLLRLSHQQGDKLPYLKSMVIGVGPLSKKVKEMADAVGVQVLECYGQAENGWTIAMEQIVGDGKSRTRSYKGLPGLKYKVIDQNGDTIESKESRIGRLAVTGPSVMKAYRGLKNELWEKATKNVIRGTWLYTGDIARLNGEGETLEIEPLGRSEDLLDRKGEYVSPAPTDDAIFGMPGTVDGAGFVLRNINKQKFLACAVVKGEKSLVKEGDVLAYLQERMPESLVPQIVVFVETIPRTLGHLVHRYRLSRQFDGIALEAMSATPSPPPPTYAQDAGAVAGPPAAADTQVGAAADALASAVSGGVASLGDIELAIPATPLPGPGSDEAPSAEAPELKPEPKKEPDATSNGASSRAPTPKTAPAPAALAPAPAPAPTAPTAATKAQPARAKPAVAKTAPVNTHESDTFITFGVDRLVANEPLPVDLYFYKDFRFVILRRKNSMIDRVMYDRLEMKQIFHLFVLESDLPVLKRWSETHLKPNPSAPAPNPVIEKARAELKAQTLEVFRSQHPEKRVAELIGASKKLVDVIMAAPYASKPLAMLQKLPKGTLDHSMNVSVISVYLGMQMGYSHAVILQHLGLGGLVHDIGKQSVPVSDKDKPEQIEAKMRDHPKLGVELLESGGAIPREVKMIVAQHHECHDGTGFPAKMRGSQIYELARIVAIANTFENLVAGGKGTLEQRQIAAVQEIETKMPRKFDPGKLGRAVKILKLGI